MTKQEEEIKQLWRMLIANNFFTLMLFAMVIFLMIIYLEG